MEAGCSQETAEGVLTKAQIRNLGNWERRAKGMQHPLVRLHHHWSPDHLGWEWGLRDRSDPLLRYPTHQKMYYKSLLSTVSISYPYLDRMKEVEDCTNWLATLSKGLAASNAVIEQYLIFHIILRLSLKLPSLHRIINPFHSNNLHSGWRRQRAIIRSELSRFPYSIPSAFIGNLHPLR